MALRTTGIGKIALLRRRRHSASTKAPLKIIVPAGVARMRAVASSIQRASHVIAPGAVLARLELQSRVRHRHRLELQSRVRYRQDEVPRQDFSSQDESPRLKRASV